jgi:hypothetical protein
VKHPEYSLERARHSRTKESALTALSLAGIIPSAFFRLKSGSRGEISEYIFSKSTVLSVSGIVE